MPNGTFLSHNELQTKYNMKTYLATVQIIESIPKIWTTNLKQNIFTTPILNIKKQHPHQ